MQLFIKILNIILPIFYFFSFNCYFIFFKKDNKNTKFAGSILLLIGILLHISFLLFILIESAKFPISSFVEAISMVSLDIAIIYFILEKSKKERKTGVFFTFIVFVLQFIATFFLLDGSIKSEHHLLANSLFGIHTFLTLLGISGLAISALYGLMYWMQAKEMKSHHFGVIYNGLPSLESLEDLGRMSMLLGIIFMGLGILLGHIWAKQVLGFYFMVDPKIIITDITWIIYTFIWFFMWRNKWRGLLFGRIALFSFILFIMSIVFVNIFAPTFHRFN